MCGAILILTVVALQRGTLWAAQNLSGSLVQPAYKGHALDLGAGRWEVTNIYPELTLNFVL